MAANGTVNGMSAHGVSHDANGVSEVNGLPFYKPTPADITIDNHKNGDKPKIFFKDVNIFDSTGADIYPGNVLIEGEHIKQVGRFDFTPDADTLVLHGHGKKTLMSGLCDAHTHLSWNNSPTLDGLTSLPLEEHVLHTAESAKTVSSSDGTSQPY